MPDPQMKLPPGATLVSDGPAMKLPPGATLVTATQQTLDPNQPGMQPKDSAFFSDLRNMITSAPEAAIKTLPGFQQYQQVKDAMADYDSVKATGKTRAQLADAQRKQAGYRAGYRALAPVAEGIGVNVSGMEQAAKEGDAPAVLGHAAAAAAPVVAGAIGGEMLRTPQGVRAVQAVKDALPSSGVAADSVKTAIDNMKPTGPQAKVMPSALNLPNLARQGAEDIFRAAAPTGKNVGFRENLYVAAPDLADIAHKMDLAEAKGGIVNPDMRVRATVDALNDHLKEMYDTEAAPQIQRNASTPVDMKLGIDAQEGLKYLKRSGASDAIRSVAAKALEEQNLTVAETDKLRLAGNNLLQDFESMTPAERAQAAATSRRLGSLKALDKELGGKLNDTLTSVGEDGLRNYERRYAAVSEIRNQLADRINATELKQDGLMGAMGKVTRPLAKLVTGGKSGIASASQAAVADVNTGSMLQSGFDKLKRSGVGRQK